MHRRTPKCGRDGEAAERRRSCPACARPRTSNWRCADGSDRRGPATNPDKLIELRIPQEALYGNREGERESISHRDLRGMASGRRFRAAARVPGNAAQGVQRLLQCRAWREAQIRCEEPGPGLICAGHLSQRNSEAAGRKRKGRSGTRSMSAQGK